MDEIFPKFFESFESQEPLPSQAPPQKSSVEDLLLQMMGQLNDLKKENTEIKNTLAEVKANPHILQGSMGEQRDGEEVIGYDKFARHATLVTRPVVDNPQEYNHIIDSSKVKRGA